MTGYIPATTLCTVINFLKVNVLIEGCLDVETMEKRKYQPLFSVLGSIGLENPMLTANSVRTEKQTPQNLTV